MNHANEPMGIAFSNTLLDLYVHELIAQRMLEVFEKRRAPSPAYLRFKFSNETLDRIRAATAPGAAGAAFDLELREQLSLLTFQDPDRIAEGIRLISTAELWNEIAVHFGAGIGNRAQVAKSV